jgi:hypothetical protein
VVKGYLISLVMPPEKNKISARLFVFKLVLAISVVAFSDVCG